MGTTQEAGQHLVLFVAAGDGSEAAIDAVARRLAEKFGTPYERMLASVRKTPRVFKRNMSLEQAESYAAMLRSMGAVAEVQSNGAAGESQPPEPAASPPPAEAADPAGKPPPPEAVDQTCPFCGRDLQAGGVCVICKPQETVPAEVAPDAEPHVPSTSEPGAVEIELPPADSLLDPGTGFQDPLQPEIGQDVPAGEGIEVGAAGSGPVEAGCANCGGLLNQVGQCPVCDLGDVEPAPGTPDPAAAAQDESTSIENDLSALLSPEELGVCPNCGVPMEQDGTCLICPPPDPSKQPPAQAVPAAEAIPQDMAPDTPPAEPPVAPLEAHDPPPSVDADPVSPEPAREGEASPFEPLAPLNAEPERAGVNVCGGCGGPKGTDGICLICGEDADSGKKQDPIAATLPADDDMAVTRNEPPPAEPVIPELSSMPAAAQAVPAAAPEVTGEEAAHPAESGKKARATRKKKGRGFDLSSLPRGLTIPLILTVVLLAGGIGLALSGKFIIASGVYFVALLAGLVSVAGAINYLQQTVDSFPKLPKVVIIAFICFLFFAGSGSIVGYALKQSAIYLLETHGEDIQAEVARLAAEEGIPVDAETGGAAGTAHADGGGQIIKEEDMLDRAITAEDQGEENPRAALDTWSAYLEGFPNGSRASEARSRISHWKTVVKKDDALNKIIDRDRRGNNDPGERIRDWQSCLATYGGTQFIRDHAEERIEFWESIQQNSNLPKFPYWASLRMDDGREFSGKVVAENNIGLKMELPNRLKMRFRKGEYEIIESDPITGKRVEAEQMQLMSGVTADQPQWGLEDNITILGDDRSGVQSMVSFRMTGYYQFEIMARASKDLSGFPSVLILLNGKQQERIRFDSEEWKLYKVTLPFRIPAGEHRLDILFPSHYQTMQDKRTVAIDYFSTSMVE